MKFKLAAFMRSNPEFSIKGQAEPVSVGGTIGGALHATIGPFQGNVSEIPFKCVIPFLHRRHANKLVGSIGGFNASMRPFGVNVENAHMRIDTVVGQNGLRGQADIAVKCQTEMKADGETSGKAKNMVINFDDESGIHEIKDSEFSARRDITP